MVRGNRATRRAAWFSCSYRSLTASALHWLIDSGANICVADPDDPCVMKVYLDKEVRLGTACGTVVAHEAVLNTPLGPKRGLVCKGSPRLLPAQIVADGGYRLVWENKHEFWI